MKKQIIKIVFILLLTISVTPSFSQQSRSWNPSEEDMSEEDVRKDDGGISWGTIFIIGAVIYSLYWQSNKNNQKK